MRYDDELDLSAGADAVTSDRADRAQVEQVEQRLAAACELTRAADNKAVGLLTAAGVLAAAGALVTGVPMPGSVASVAARVAGTGLVVALVALLLVLLPRGGAPTGWLPEIDPRAELVKVGGIAAVKHRLLRIAVAALVVAVLSGVIAAGGAW